MPLPPVVPLLGPVARVTVVSLVNIFDKILSFYAPPPKKKKEKKKIHGVIGRSNGASKPCTHGSDLHLYANFVYMQILHK